MFFSHFPGKLLLATLLVAATPYLVPAQTTTSATAPTDSLARLAGKWAGTYDGADAGNFELILTPATGNALTGQIIMLAPDGNRYPIDLKSAVWQNGRLIAAYTDPQSGNAVSFSGTFADASLKGTWKVGDGEAAGTWQVNRADR